MWQSASLTTSLKSNISIRGICISISRFFVFPRSRLADFISTCQPEARSVSGCLRENYADCLLSYSGLIGEWFPQKVSQIAGELVALLTVLLLICFGDNQGTRGNKGTEQNQFFKSRALFFQSNLFVLFFLSCFLLQFFLCLIAWSFRLFN